jgi:hypothetical protein
MSKKAVPRSLSSMVGENALAVVKKVKIVCQQDLCYNTKANVHIPASNTLLCHGLPSCSQHIYVASTSFSASAT